MDTKYLLFDIGNVLADFDDRDLLSFIISTTTHPPGQATAREPELDDLVEKGLISDEEYVVRLNEAKGLCWSLEDLTQVWSRVFTLNERGRNLYTEAIQSGIPVYLLSNIARFHVEAIKNNWPGFFDGAAGLFLSYRIGVRKPHPDIYRHVLDQLGVDGRQCLFIDDMPVNVDAARAVGIDAHCFSQETHAEIRMVAKAFFDA